MTHSILTPAEAGYIAGIIDGEGCLAISKRMAPRGQNYSYRAEAIIAQAARGHAMLLWLQARIGGVLHPTNSGHALRLGARDTERLLDVIAPYSVIKGEQVTLLRAFFATFHDTTEGRFAERESLFQQLHSLHGGSKARKRKTW